MLTIYKYKLNVHGEQIIELPGVGRILHVGVQNNVPYVWCEVDVQTPVVRTPEKKYLHIFQTGEEIPREIINQRKYIGTFLIDGGDYVGHVYQIIR